MLPQMKRVKAKGKRQKAKFARAFSFAFCLLPFAFLLSCQSQSTDLRTFAPSETLVYLETSDLANTLNALTENEIFTKLAAGKKDFSALENVQLAVAVTGFETSQQQVAGEQTILKFKPNFVAIADTHAWNWQAISLTENQKIGRASCRESVYISVVE